MKINNNWLYKKSSIFIEDFFCGASWIRTSDTRIFSPLLYQLSYGTFKFLFLQSVTCQIFGGASWIRTSDTRIFSPLLYQLSYGTFFLTCPLPNLRCKYTVLFRILKLLP